MRKLIWGIKDKAMWFYKFSFPLIFFHSCVENAIGNFFWAACS